MLLIEYFSDMTLFFLTVWGELQHHKWEVYCRSPWWDKYTSYQVRISLWTKNGAACLCGHEICLSRNYARLLWFIPQNINVVGWCWECGLMLVPYWYDECVFQHVFLLVLSCSVECVLMETSWAELSPGVPVQKMCLLVFFILFFFSFCSLLKCRFNQGINAS